MVLTYKGIHTKLVREIGKANEFECVDCGKQAHEWSYVHDTDPQDIDNYDPRCRSCHKLYDGIKPTKFGHITICPPGCECKRHYVKPGTRGGANFCMPDCTCGRHRGSKR